MMIDVRNVVAVDGSFSGRLRSLLADHGMSQAELARRTGINYAALTATVNGRRRPTTREVGLLAHELKVDLLEFIGIADTVAEHGVLIEQREHLRGRLTTEQARASHAESSLRQARREAERAAETVQERLARVTGECEDLQRQLRAEGQRTAKAEQAHAESACLGLGMGFGVGSLPMRRASPTPTPMNPMARTMQPRPTRPASVKAVHAIPARRG